MKTFPVRVGWLGSIASVLAFATASPADTASDPPNVIGGVATKACGFPSTVSFGGWGSCSGTLMSRSDMVEPTFHPNPDSRDALDLIRGATASCGITMYSVAFGRLAPPDG